MIKCRTVFECLGACLLVFCAVFMFTTCEVGLGNSVDTQPPSVTISYPPEAAIIRGSFVMNGGAADETFVKDVSVLFTSTVDAGKIYGPYPAEINKDSKIWSISLNAKNAASGTYAIPDGKYAVTVTAMDSASRSSVAATVYEIDNTAPVLYVQRPGSKDESAPDTYGSSISVSGQVYDAHLISKLIYSAYEKDAMGTFVKKGEKVLENIAPNINLVLADFDDEKDTLYKNLYGDDKNAGEKTFYCTISVEDEARWYTGQDHLPAEGNKTEGYFLFDEVSGLISVKDLYTALSTGTEIPDDLQNSLDSIFIKTTDETNVQGIFSLDPAVSPKWRVINLPVFSEGYLDNDVFRIPAGSSLTIRVEPSLNNSPIVDDSLAVYVQKASRTGVVEPDAEKIYLMKKAADIENEADREERKNSITAVGSNRTLTINSLTLLAVNTSYRLFAEGSDAAGNSVTTVNTSKYGFFLEGNGAPPDISLTNLSYYTKPNGQFEITGSSVSQSGDPVNITVALPNGDFLSQQTINSGSTWSVVSTAADLIRLAGGSSDLSKSKTYSLEIRAQSGISTTAVKNCSVYYDAEKPVPEIASVTPQVSANGKDTNVNGVILFKGTASDEDKVESSVLKLYTADSLTSAWTPLVWTPSSGFVSVPAGTTNDAMRFSYKINTAASVFGDKKYLKLEVISNDRAGNTGTAELILFIDQTTDAPVVSFFNLSDGNNLFGYSGNNKILGTVTDDDGLASVELYIDNETIARKVYSSAVLEGTKSKSFEYDLVTDIPATLAALTEGDHTLFFKITDTEGLVYKTGRKTFVVDTAAPIVAVTAPTAGGFAGASVTVRGTSSDTRGIARVEYKKPDETWVSVTPKAANDWSTWSHIISAQADTGSGSGYTRVFRATDVSGRTTETSVTYKVDTTVPTFAGTLKFSGYKNGTENYPGIAASLPVWLTAQAQTISGTLTEVNPGMINYTVTGKTVASGSVSVTSGTDQPFRTTVMFEEGESTVSFNSSDMAGNTAVSLTRKVYVDVSLPVLADITLTGAIVSGSDYITSGSSDINVFVTATDAVSGVALTADVGNGANFKGSGIIVSGALEFVSENRYKMTIPAAKIKNLGNGIHGLYIRVSDKAGNKTEAALPKLIVDIEAPTVTYTAPPTGATVNKIIDLKGSVSDTNMTENAIPALFVWNPSSGGGIWQSVGTPESTCDIKINGLVFQPVTSGSDWIISGFNTALFSAPYDTNTTADGVQCKLQVRFTDRAGNTSPASANTLTLTFDQFADRPVVKISNMSFAGMASATPVWLKQTRTIFGTISDDDGIQLMEISEDGGTVYHQITVESGAWNYELSADGMKTVLFKVTDSAGTQFLSRASASESDLLVSPVISDGTHVFGAKGSSGAAADSRLHIKIDTQPPLITSVEYQQPGNGLWANTFPTEKFGGIHNSVSLRVTASDANEIASVQFLKNGTLLSSLTLPGAGNFWTTQIPTDSGNGYQDVAVKVTDSAGLETVRTVQINIDNTAPLINIDSHRAGEQVNGEIVLKGTTDGASSMQYSVEKQANAVIDWSNRTKAPSIVGSSFVSWRIYFDDKSVISETHGKTMNEYLVSLGITTAEAIKNNTYTALTDLYIYLRAVDECGNSNVQTIKLVVDPQGDRPKVAVTYPDRNGEILGGTIRMTGTAEDNSKVSAVYVQIDPKYNGVTVAPKLDQASWDAINTTFGTSYTLESFGSAGVTQSGFKVTGTLSWNFSLNTKGEFDPADDGNRQIALRLYALDENGNISQPYDRIITVDKDTPLIGNSKALYLRKYDRNGNLIASIEYTDDMWISGLWFLEGSIEDASGIKELTVTNPDKSLDRIVTAVSDTAGSLTDPSKATAVPSNGAFGVNSGYLIKIPVGSDADSFGMLSYTIRATESTSKNLYAEKNIRLNYDNKAPVIRVSGDSGFNIGSQIVNSNGFYTMGSVVNEDSSGLDNQSGFARVVFYFERTLNGVTAVYDPMLKQANPANKIATSGLKQESGLWWKEKTVTRDASSLPVLYLNAADENIRTGGIVKIGGTIYRITKVEGSKVTIDGSPDVSSVAALFALAQVADNLTTETANTSVVKDENGYYPVVNDDGDGMVEGVTKIGTEYVWEASINSKNIPDGSVTIRYVVFDKAGNYTTGSVAGTVSNNRPRIAGVRFGTDDNGNGVVEESEFVASWSGLYTTAQTGLPNGYSSTNVKVHELNVQRSDGSAVLKIKGNTVVKPEIVGGNNGLAYTYAVTKKGQTGAYYTQTVPAELSALHSDTDDVRTGLNNISLSVKDFLSPGTTGTEIADANDQRFSFTIWDKTDGTVQGTDSQYAQIHIVMDVALRDNVSPTAAINTFFWNSETDNSLYLNSLTNGHIELESDLPSAEFTSGGTGVYDRDPKVSGKIVITGTANDNNLLSELHIRIPGFTDSGTGGYIQVARRDSSGIWTSAGTLVADGWQFVCVKDSFSQSEGNTLEWKLYWDSEKIASAAASDVAVQVRATDRGAVRLSGSTLSYVSNAPSAASSVQTTAALPTPYYRMDVVPYINKVTTNLSKLKVNNPSVYNRTALGRYPVSASETITISGFNLNGADVGGSTITGETYANGTVTVPVINAASGNLTLKVNGISILNNNNSNTAVYNRQPNKDNNNLLTDDVILDVWDFNEQAAVPISGRISDPVMKINPVSGMIGFAFTNGPLYFSMGGTVNGVEYSYEYWQASFDFLSSIAFAYDSQGHSYGAAAGGDINASEADKFTFMTDRWGKSGTVQNGSYAGTNALRLESIGQKNGGVIDFNKYRIKSPTYVTSRPDNSSTNIYMAYYDDINGEIRFRYGNLPDSSSVKTNFGNFIDSERSGAPSTYDRSRVSIIAGTGTGRNAGEYLSIGVVPESVAGKEIVVAVWYDAVNATLWYSYNDTPTVDRAGTNDGSGWSAPISIFSNAGEYCQLSVDADGGIHIAAYDIANADLVYAYLDNYAAAGAETCTVDSYGIVGTNITIDTAKVGGKIIPYIGYYALSSVRPKYAYLADTSVKAPAGVLNEEYTGAWEITLLPTASSVSQDRINIGVWKDTSGILKNSVTGSSRIINNRNGYNSTSRGFCYGNGTSNAVLAYATKANTNGYIETAQKR